MSSETLLQVVSQLHQIGAVKFGSFRLKSGAMSPVYVDFRSVLSHPRLLNLLSKLISEKINSILNAQTEGIAVCGVPYGAIPLATAIGIETGLPLALVRKEGAKQHGTGKSIEMSESVSQVLLIEDVVTSGMSILETVDVFAASAPSVKLAHAFCLLDRMQGGSENLAKRGIKLHHVFDLPALMTVLCDELKAIDESTKSKVMEYLSAPAPKPVTPAHPAELTYLQRVEKCQNAVGKNLLQLMERKKSNLALAADVTKAAELIQLADTVGPHIAILKTHIDILDDYTPEVVQKLQELAKKHDFLLFEDRKFADIGATVKSQYTRGVYRISSWSDIVNCHLVSGKTIIQALKEGIDVNERSLLLLAQMSTVDAQTNDKSKVAALEAARENRDFVCGFICQERLDQNELGFIYMTPGVNLSDESSVAAGAENIRLGQQYNDPSYVIGTKKSDVIIVGSGIYKKKTSEEQLAAAKRFQEAGWSAYEARLPK